MTKNSDPRVVEDFGAEWERFNQQGVSKKELFRQFEKYFQVFPWDHLPRQARGFDLGCGSGRWAQFVAPRVGQLTCVDASDRALKVAQDNLVEHTNCQFICASVDALPFEDETMDFGYSLGVLHQVPDSS